MLKLSSEDSYDYNDNLYNIQTNINQRPPSICTSGMMTQAVLTPFFESAYYRIKVKEVRKGAWWILHSALVGGFFWRFLCAWCSHVVLWLLRWRAEVFRLLKVHTTTTTTRLECPNKKTKLLNKNFSARRPFGFLVEEFTRGGVISLLLVCVEREPDLVHLNFPAFPDSEQDPTMSTAVFENVSSSYTFIFLCIRLGFVFVIPQGSVHVCSVGGVRVVQVKPELHRLMCSNKVPSFVFINN